jgi:ATP-dependent helicase/DNAse subunit B
MSSGVNRREFLNVGLAGAALLALTSCATFRGSKSDLDVAITDLKNTVDGFEGDGAREARLASLGRRIENRCREVTEDYIDYLRRFDTLSSRRETTSSELKELVEDFSTRRERYRKELLGTQDELRQTLTKEEWNEVVKVLNSGVEAFSQTTKERS